MSIEKVVIIIPTYNEALVIEETLAEVFQETSDIPNMAIHVLVFDSQSTDSTQALVTQLQKNNPRLHLKTEPKKSGLGAAYRQAMEYALTELSADIVFEFDADRSHQPKYIGPMLEKIRTHDVVVGSRYVPGGSIPKEWGWHRKCLSVLGNYVARLMLTRRYKDFTSGFRATRRQVLTAVLPEKFISNQYAYKIQLLWLLHKVKARICEYPIDFIDRQKGHSKLPANSISDSLHVLFSLRFQELKVYFKMCLVGLSGVGVQFMVYNVLRQSLSPIIATQMAIIIAIISNFALNNRYTFKRMFKVPRYQKIKSLSLFTGYSVLMIILQSYWLHLGIKYFGTGFLSENLSIFSGMIVGSFFNYLTYSRLIWRERKVEPSTY
jgi:dolichol-phosphate mannosyltransferase